MTGGHDHASAISASGRHRRPLVIALLLTSVYMVVEVTVGLRIGSLALISDAGHMLTDVAGIGMALAAIQVAQTKRSPQATFGFYRLEVLAALANTVLLFAVAAYVLVEAWQRFRDPADVPGVWLLVVAAIGLAVNLVAFALLRRGAGDSLNVRGAFLEVLSDAVGSVGVIVAGIVVITTGWRYADPIVGVGIGLFILPRAYRLGRDALRVLLQVAPSDVDLAAVRRDLLGVPGVAGLHDLHAWTLTSGLVVASAHLDLSDGAESTTVVQEATQLLEERHRIQHVTLQVEVAGGTPHEELVI